MKMGVNVNNEWLAVQKRFREAAQKGTATGLKQGMEAVLIFLTARIKEKVSEKFKNTPKGKGVASLGSLRSSWAWEVVMSGNKANGKIGTWAKHAPLQEFGGQIKPKTGKALTIPFLEKTKGRPYPPAKELRSQGKTVIISRKGKSGLIALKPTEPGGRAKPIYALRPSVVIPARPYVQPVIDKYGKGVADLIGGSVVKQVAPK